MHETALFTESVISNKPVTIHCQGIGWLAETGDKFDITEKSIAAQMKRSVLLLYRYLTIYKWTC